MTTLRKHPQSIALLLIAITVILYALAARDGHNWKGDFSQYVMHAQNLVQGKPYTDLGVLSIDGVAHAGTPPGYPIAIAPVLVLFGLNLIALKIQMAMIFGIGLTIYWYHIKQDLPQVWALSTLAFLCFTPWILKFSHNLLTDLPFLTSSLFALYLTHRFFQHPPKIRSAIYVAISLLIACSFRSIGVVIIGTITIYAILFRRKHLIHAIGITLVSYVAVGLIYRLFEAGGSYASQFSLHPYVIASAIWSNLIGLERTLTLILAQYPSRNEESWLYIAINKPILLAYLSLLGIGFYRSYKKRGIYIQDLYVPLSLVPLLIYPYPMRPRYLLPLLPFTHFYAIIGFRCVIGGILKYLPQKPLKSMLHYRAFLPTLIWMPLFLAYWGHYTLHPTTDEANVFQNPDVQGLFQEIQNQQETISHVLFWRPRILRLMTGVPSAGVYNIDLYAWSPDEITRIHNAGVSHIVLDPYNPNFASFTKQHPKLFESVYQNNTFHLMRIVKDHQVVERTTP